jgi:hypothetical protein
MIINRSVEFSQKKKNNTVMPPPLPSETAKGAFFFLHALAQSIFVISKMTN